MVNPDAMYRQTRLDHEARILVAIRSREAAESRRERGSLWLMARNRASGLQTDDAVRRNRFVKPLELHWAD